MLQSTLLVVAWWSIKFTTVGNWHSYGLVVTVVVYATLLSTSEICIYITT